LLLDINKIYKDDKLDAKKKVMMFTTDICIPEILNQQKVEEKKEQDLAEQSSSDENKEIVQEAYLSIQNDQDKDLIPLVCFYNGLSFLKRLPTVEEISESDKKLDLLQGFRTKDSFIELKKEHDKKSESCSSDLQNLYEDSIDGRLLDGLLPFQEKYVGNSYIDVYSYFCKNKPQEINTVK
jgi:hypothetical protein